MINSRIKSFVPALAALVFTATCAEAGQRRFAYSYETTTAPKGSRELETWVTWKHSNNVDKFDFRHELELGLTDRLQLGIYLSDWSYNESDLEHQAKWKDAGFSVVYALTNPVTDFIGSALYGEVLLGEEIFKLEGKLLLQKNFGPLIVAWNGIIEAEWEGDGYHEQVGVLEQTAGISYELNKHVSLGAELKHEVEFENWEEAGDSVVWVGPNASFRVDRYFAALAGLWQVSDVEGEPDFQGRIIFGFDF